MPLHTTHSFRGKNFYPILYNFVLWEFRHYNTETEGNVFKAVLMLILVKFYVIKTFIIQPITTNATNICCGESETSCKFSNERTPPFVKSLPEHFSGFHHFKGEKKVQIIVWRKTWYTISQLKLWKFCTRSIVRWNFLQKYKILAYPKTNSILPYICT